MGEMVCEANVGAILAARFFFRSRVSFPVGEKLWCRKQANEMICIIQMWYIIYNTSSIILNKIIQSMIYAYKCIM